MIHFISKIGKWILYIIAGVVSLIVIFLIAFYIPPIQDAIFNKIVTSLNKGGTLHIEYEKLRIGFPLHLKGEKIAVDLPGEMDASVGYIDANIDLLPIFSLDISSDKIDISHADFRLGNPDSSIFLNAAIDTFNVESISVKIKDADIKFKKAFVISPDVSLMINPADEKEDTIAKKKADKGFVINAGMLEMQNLSYCMSINGTIDTLVAKIENLKLTEGIVDLNKQSVKAKDFDVDGIVADYIYPMRKTSSQTDNEHQEENTGEEESAPWKIYIDRIDLNATKATYAGKGVSPSDYFTPDYIEAEDFSILIDSFYNCKQEIRVPIEKLMVDNFHGLQIDAQGTFSIEKSEMKVEDFRFLLPGSSVNLSASMGLKSERYPTPAQTPVSVDLNADISPEDIKIFVPSFLPIIDGLPKSTPLLMDVVLKGTLDYLDIEELSLVMPKYLSVETSGIIGGFSSPGLKDFTSNLKFNGHLYNANIVKPSVVEAKLGKNIKIVPFDLNGKLNFNRGNGSTSLKLDAQGGDIALTANIAFKKENYKVELDASDFPVQAILPNLKIRDVSATLSASGNRFNPLKSGSDFKANIDVLSLIYNDINLRNIVLNTEIQNGDASIILVSNMPEADFALRANGNVGPKDFSWNINGDIRRVELEELGFSKNSNGGMFRFDANVNFIPDSMFINADLRFPVLKWTIDDRIISTRKLELQFDSDNSGTAFDIADRDLLFNIYSPEPLDSILKDIQDLKIVIDSCIKNTYLNVDEVQSHLPKFDLTFSALKDNILSSWLSQRGEYVDSIGVSLSNERNLNFNAFVKNYNTPKYVIDSLTVQIDQHSDSLFYDLNLFSNPLSPGDWDRVKLFGRLGGNEVNVRFNQKNAEGKTGFLLGLNAEVQDSTITVNLVPTKPVVAYKQWEINQDNFIQINFAKKHFDANLIVSHGNSSLKLFTDHLNGSEDQEAINLSLDNIQIGDWMALNPFATPMKGVLQGNVSLSHEGNVYTGDGELSLIDFIYGKQRVGTFTLGLDVSTTPHGFLHAGASLDIDSVKVVNIYGMLNDTTQVEPFFLKLDIDSLPLKVVNPFLKEAGIQLSGNLDGSMKITGTPSSPVFNGYIDFDNTGIKVEMLGTTYFMSEKKIPVDTGIVKFDNYDIKAVNNNPVIIDGTVNMRDILNPGIDISIIAENTQIVGTDRARGNAEIYGKAYIDFDATVKGDMSYMKIDADAKILNTTNITYILVGGTQNSLTSRSNSDLVKFVNFADSTSVNAADSIQLHGTLMNINALLSIMRGAVISVDLSSDGKNKVQLEPSGDLDYTRDILGAQHLTGRLNINGGFARYTPPLMSEKLFNFQEGSYVEFNGNITNPRLNIHAVDRVRANVTQEGQNSRLIYFNVGLDITGSLENMDVAFDLSTDDDLTVENELESMSASQRASKAMNLLLTNMYTGPGTSADANMGANALYSFLGSTLNSWAANNVKFVDLSFGVNQYDNTTNGVTSQATSYSYNVSKSLFDDRFKISVGGNYTTDADADENFAQNLISDVSLEYILNPNGSMSVKIFRHAGFESILEGEVVQTGIGFTYKKRLNSLRQMFWFLLPKEYRYNAIVSREEERLSREQHQNAK